MAQSKLFGNTTEKGSGNKTQVVAVFDRVEEQMSKTPKFVKDIDVKASSDIQSCEL